MLRQSTSKPFVVRVNTKDIKVYYNQIYNSQIDAVSAYVFCHRSNRKLSPKLQYLSYIYNNLEAQREIEIYYGTDEKIQEGGLGHIPTVQGRRESQGDLLYSVRL